METLNDTLVAITGQIDDFMYTWILVFLLVAVGIYFTIRTKVVQIRYIKDMFTNITEKKHVEGGHSISSFQAMMVSTASRVGTGNIAGIATAIATGGPGAVFWMWIMCLSARLPHSSSPRWLKFGKCGLAEANSAVVLPTTFSKHCIPVGWASFSPSR